MYIKPISREYIFECLSAVQHPEIGLSLVHLGMILDVAVEEEKARIAIALPTQEIPSVVKGAIEQSISQALQKLKLRTQVEYFLMLPEVRDNFFKLARENWRASGNACSPARTGV
jgi:metal-sulfur cluster biosynthetic enzyme